MADTGPWTFGLTQLLTVVGLGMATLGLRTFGKWQREKIEERRIDLTLEALSLAYGSKAIFGHIRSRVMGEYEPQHFRLVSYKCSRRSSRKIA
jgi:hypothetical protein